LEVFGHRRARDITLADGESFKALLLKKPKVRGKGVLSPRMVKNILNTFASVLEYGRRHEIVKKRVTEFLKRPECESTRIALEREDYRAYLQAFSHDEKVGPIVITTMGTGLRRGEVLALKREDYDAENGTLRVDSALVRDERVTYEEDPKTKKSIRTMYLPPFVVAAINRQLKAQLERFMKTTDRPGPDTLIFDRGCGDAWVPSTFSSAYDRAVKKYKLSRVTFHELRHTFAMALGWIGASPTDQRDALGHEHAQISTDVYANHADRQRAKELAQALHDFGLGLAG
jgi:integrase